MKNNRKYFASVFFLCLNFMHLRSQVNLIINGSFEDTIVCSSSMSSLHQLPAQYWYQYNSVDYYRHNPNYYCTYSGSNGGGNVPYNLAAFQNPRSRNSYIGLITNNPYSGMEYYREWIQSKLTDTLDFGKAYCVSFWYNQANYSIHATDRLGIYFSLSGVNLSTTFSFTQYNHQIETPAGQFLNDTLDWKKFQTSYTASGNETFFTLGNFYDSVQTATQLFPNSSFPFADAYYLIDDISVIPIDLPASAGKDTSMCEGDSVYIGRPYEVGLDNIWTEITTGTAIDTGAGFWLHADSSATYVVAQDLCGTVTYDTIRVLVNCNGIENFLNESRIKVYPSPTKDVINIEGELPEAEAFISDVLGNVILRRKFSHQLQINASEIPAGIYFVRVRAQGMTAFQKVVVQH